MTTTQFKKHAKRMDKARREFCLITDRLNINEPKERIAAWRIFLAAKGLLK